MGYLRGLRCDGYRGVIPGGGKEGRADSTVNVCTTPWGLGGGKLDQILLWNNYVQVVCIGSVNIMTRYGSGGLLGM